MDTHNIVESLLSLVKLAWAEDIASGDLSAQLISDEFAEANIITRQSAIYCGSVWVKALQINNFCSFTVIEQARDGAKVHSNQTVLRLSGKLSDLLTLERVLLNGIQILSATATQTQRLVRLIQDYPCRLLDTRKTIPGWRKAQKYAVKMGGGSNHRFGLYDAIMLKENHQRDQFTLTQQVTIAKRQTPDIPIIIEVENLSEFELALSLTPQQILLDNFSLADIKQATHFNKSNKINIKLEASGNISEHNIQQIAACGVDFISVGSITKNIQAIDFSMLAQQR